MSEGRNRPELLKGVVVMEYDAFREQRVITCWRRWRCLDCGHVERWPYHDLKEFLWCTKCRAPNKRLKIVRKSEAGE